MTFAYDDGICSSALPGLCFNKLLVTHSLIIQNVDVLLPPSEPKRALCERNPCHTRLVTTKGNLSIPKPRTMSLFLRLENC